MNMNELLREIEENAPDVVNEATYEAAESLGTPDELDELLKRFKGKIPLGVLEACYGIDTARAAYDRALSRRIDGLDDQEQAEYDAWANRMNATIDRAREALSKPKAGTYAHKHPYKHHKKPR
jgi:hypothetical protein